MTSAGLGAGWHFRGCFWGFLAALGILCEQGWAVPAHRDHFGCCIILPPCEKSWFKNGRGEGEEGHEERK